MKIRSYFIGALFIVAAGWMGVGTGNAAVVTSSNFSIGYGFTQNSPNGWNTNETNSTNTYLPAGDFTLSISLTAPPLSASGPTFTNGVLGNTTGSSYAAYTQGNSRNFQVTSLASYAGIIPEEATNIQMQLTITSISIYAGRVSTEVNSGNTANFVETTSGHTSAQSPIVLTAYTNIGLASDYSLLSWNPDDYSTSGASQSRSFSIDTVGNGLQRIALDGFRIEGFATLTYDVVPEPSTCVLVGLGLIAFCFVRRRKVPAQGL